jgi:hypothetical protein
MATLREAHRQMQHDSPGVLKLFIALATAISLAVGGIVAIGSWLGAQTTSPSVRIEQVSRAVKDGDSITNRRIDSVLLLGMARDVRIDRLADKTDVLLLSQCTPQFMAKLRAGLNRTALKVCQDAQTGQ